MARPRGTRQQRQRQAILATGAGKLIGYVRVSTAGQATNGHSLDGQRTRLQEAATREGLELVDVVCDVESGAKQRDGLDAVQARVAAGEAQGIAFPKVDRLGRSMIHLLKIVAWAKESGADLLRADEGCQVRDGQEVDKMLPFRQAMAQVELERIRERTREGLRAARAKGIVPGPKPQNVALQARATELRRGGMGLQEIADLFTREGHRTAAGTEYKPTTVWRMVNREDPQANPEGGYQGNALAAVA